MSTLSAAVRTTLGTFTLDVAFEIDSPSITSLFGRSGAGKSTVLRCLAGLCRPRSARIEVGGDVWQDGRCFVPPHRRAVGLVFQDAALFPHKDVAGNLRYGLSRVPKARRRIAFDDVVRWLDLERLLERRCASLSGGERQRVALARAILTSPRLLLLDEPLASLDRDSRRAILPYLERLPARLAIPVVLVTHSLTEVARLADRVVVLADGRVTASGPTTAILPELDAETFGGTEAAVVEGTVEAHDADGLTRIEAACGTLLVPRVDALAGDRVRVRVAARDVSLALAPDRQSSILNELPCAVTGLRSAEPGQVIVTLRAPGDTVLLARITERSRAALGLASGATVYARVKGVSLVE